MWPKAGAITGLRWLRDPPVWPLINYNKEEVSVQVLVPSLHTRDSGFLNTAPSHLSQGFIKAKFYKFINFIKFKFVLASRRSSPAKQSKLVDRSRNGHKKI